MEFAVSLLFPNVFAAERRAGPRYRVAKAALVELPGERRRLAANIVNMSAGGAALELSAPAALPATFDLLIAAEGLRCRAALKWRRGALAGVQFLGEARRMDR